MYSDGHKISLSKAVINQYCYKLKAYSSCFCALVLIQLITVLFFSRTNQMGTSVGNISLTSSTYSSMSCRVFTIIWIVIISMMISSVSNKDMIFTLPCNRLTDGLSDVGFIMTGCVFGTVTTVLLSMALRVEVYFLNMGNVLAEGFYPIFGELCVIAISTFLYMLLFASAGYLAGVLIRWNKVFIILIPMCLMGVLIYAQMGYFHSYLTALLNFFINENLLALFAVKTVLIASILFALGITLTNGMEVKK